MANETQREWMSEWEKSDAVAGAHAVNINNEILVLFSPQWKTRWVKRKSNEFARVSFSESEERKKSENIQPKIKKVISTKAGFFFDKVY